MTHPFPLSFFDHSLYHHKTKCVLIELAMTFEQAKSMKIGEFINDLKRVYASAHFPFQ